MWYNFANAGQGRGDSLGLWTFAFMLREMYSSALEWGKCTMLKIQKFKKEKGERLLKFVVRAFILECKSSEEYPT